MAGSKRCASHQYTTSEDCKRLPKTESAFLSATSTGFLCEFLPSSRDNSQLSVQLCRILPSIEILRSAKRSLRDYRILPRKLFFLLPCSKKLSISEITGSGAQVRRRNIFSGTSNCLFEIQFYRNQETAARGACFNEHFRFRFLQHFHILIDVGNFSWGVSVGICTLGSFEVPDAVGLHWYTPFEVDKILIDGGPVHGIKRSKENTTFVTFVPHWNKRCQSTIPLIK